MRSEALQRSKVGPHGTHQRAEVGSKVSRYGLKFIKEMSGNITEQLVFYIRSHRRARHFRGHLKQLSLLREPHTCGIVPKKSNIIAGIIENQ